MHVADMNKGGKKRLYDKVAYKSENYEVPKCFLLCM